MRLRLFFTSVCIFMTALSAFSQVKSVSYKLDFNSETELFDVSLIINEGNAILSKSRVQFNAQVSLIAPAGSTMSVAQNYMPLSDNKNQESDKPMKWNLVNSLNDVPALDNQDVFSITPSLTPTASYNQIKQGDQIKLFSIKVSPLPKCTDGVRLFDNDLDAKSDNKDMKGADFRNGFTLGGFDQLYVGNIIGTSMLPQGQIETASINELNPNSTFYLRAGQWTNADSYEWLGPNNFKSNQKNVAITTAPNMAGIYTLTVSTKDGCTVTKSIELKVNSDVLSDVKDVVVSSYTSSIFPNPASEFINLTIDAKDGAKAVASIVDASGKIVAKNVLNQKISGKIEKRIPLNLVAGIYTLKINVDGIEKEHKFICVE